MPEPVPNHLPRRSHWVPNTDVFINPSGELIVCVELSGMQTNDIAIHPGGSKLRITGDRPSSGAATAQTVLVREINDGPFEMILDLPPAFDLSRASWDYANGALRLSVPPTLKPS